MMLREERRAWRAITHDMRVLVGMGILVVLSSLGVRSLFPDPHVRQLKEAGARIAGLEHLLATATANELEANDMAKLVKRLCCPETQL